MAQPATTPKIEELRLRLKTDPKSRIFYPLAEELRKVGQWTESEQVLRTGLVNHPSYLSAWVSLGRVSRELKNENAAVEALNRALQLDPGNVVAARLLADAYLALGEKLEALKKYKLVHALLPSDEELEATIERLDNELNPVIIAAPPPPPPEPPPPPAPEPEPEPQPAPEPVVAAPEMTAEMPWSDAPAEDAKTGDDEPMHAAHTESPFEDAVPDTYGSAALQVEAPEGIHLARAPLTADLPSFFSDEETLAPPEAPAIAAAEESDVFAPVEAPAPEQQEDLANTLTMADLYARQGLTDDARHIYESILQRDPGNAAVGEKLDALNAPPPPAAPAPASSAHDAKVARLENWLSKVSRREVSGV
jgi:tetratricopeptide (TPR) repeat protein